MDERADPGRSTTRAVLLACAIACTLALLPATAAAADVERVSFNGVSANAVFRSFDGCAQSAASVAPISGRSLDQTGVTRDMSVLVQLVRFDFCSLSSTYRFGHVDLAPGDFNLTGNFETASLDATVQLQDMATGELVPVDLDLAWEVDGGPERTKDNHVTRLPDGSLEIFHVMGRTTTAVAWGSIWDGATDWTAGGASESAGFAATRSGQVTIVR